MPSIVINSANINTFSFKVTFNPYTRQVVFDASATTYQGSGIGVIKGIAFSLIDQDGVTLLSNTFPTSQIPVPSSGQVYTLDLSSINYAFLFQNYEIIGSIQEANNAIYSTVPVYKNLCQPPNFTDTGYVPGMFQVLSDCNNNVLTVKELTLLAYNNETPLSVSKTGTLYYPTGTVASLAFMNTPFNNNVIYTGAYNIKCTTVATYDLADSVYVAVSYVTNQNFNVTCGNFLGDVSCCLSNLYSTYLKNCDNAVGKNALHQYNSVAPLVLNGIIKQSTGQDASNEVALIKQQLNCDCGTNSLGQNEVTPINPSVNSVVIQGVGGTNVPAATVTGNTITYNIGSNVYQVGKGNTGDLAYSIAIDTSTPYTVKYLITFNYDTMAGYILTAIGNDPVLLAQLNALINESTSLTGLNGNCVIDLTQINYSLSQTITGATLVTNVVIGGQNYAAPANLFANNPTAVASWLNSLSLGVFSATVTSGVLTVLSLNNTFSVSTLTFSNPNVTIQFQASSATLVQVLQAIINYLCNLTSLQVALGNAISLCSFDYNGNPISINYSSGNSQQLYNTGVSQAICSIVARISTLTAVTCSTIKSLFQDYPNIGWGNNSRAYGTDGTNCVSWTDLQLANMVIAAVGKYSTVKAAWCAIDCSAPTSCPDIASNNTGLLSTTSFGVYGVAFASATTVGQIATVKYRVSGTTSWTTSTNSLGLLANGNVSGTSPYVISGLTAGTQYDVFIQNNCGGTGFISQITLPASTLYSGLYLLDNSSYAICGDAPVTLYSSLPFAPGVVMYTDSGLTTKATGYLFIASISSHAIYQMNSTTAVVGAATGGLCNAGTLGTYQLGNSTGTICASLVLGLYTNGAFGIGQTLYTDSGLSDPATGYSYVVQLSTNQIFNINPTSGAILSNTGLLCNTNTVSIANNMAGMTLTAVTGITGFTAAPPLPLAVGGTVTGTHSGFTGTIALTITGTPTIVPSSIGLYVNGSEVDCRSVAAAGTFTFTTRTYAATDIISLVMVSSSC